MNFVYFAVFAFSAATSVHATACNEAAIAGKYSYLETTIAQWESEHRTGIAQSARGILAKEFCDAAEQAIASSRASDARIQQVAAATIEEYLERVTSDRSQIKTLQAELLSQLGAGGLSRAVRRSIGRLKVTYLKPATEVRLNSRRMPAWEMFLVPSGDVTIEGLISDSVVCRAEATIQIAQETKANCQ